MKPKVAIILPVYNVIEYIEDMIEALYNSTDFPFKLIVVDGFSDDGTVEYFKGLSKHNIEFYQIPKKGLVNAINFGMKTAGDLDVYLTQADVIHYKLYRKDWLKDMYEIAQDEKVGIVTGIGGYGVSGPACVDGFKWAGTWNTYIPRRVVNIVGDFDDQFSGMDDIDYSYRVFKERFGMMILNYWVHHHMLTDRNDTHSSEHLQDMGRLFRKKWRLAEFKEDKNDKNIQEKKEE